MPKLEDEAGYGAAWLVLRWQAGEGLGGVAMGVLTRGKR